MSLVRPCYTVSALGSIEDLVRSHVDLHDLRRMNRVPTDEKFRLNLFDAENGSRLNIDAQISRMKAHFQTTAGHKRQFSFNDTVS